MFTDLPQKFALIFVFGAGMAFLLAGAGTGVWLLTKLWRLLRRLTLPAEQREREKQAAAHPLADLSLRGKTAWLICCLEEALYACGLDAEQEEPGSWFPVLRILWEFPELPEEQIEDWLDRTSDILPSVVLSCEPGPPTTEPLSPEEQQRFAVAYGLYTEAGRRMAYLAPLLEMIYRLVREHREPPACLPEQLAILDEARQLLRDYGIPLPPADTEKFLRVCGSPGLGKQFVGRQCSGIVGW